MLLLAAAPSALGQKSGGGEEIKGFDAALERCRVLEQRNPLTYHFSGWQLLAGTKDPRAIEELMERYAKPRNPKEPYRYLLARASVSGHCDETIPALDEWRASAAEPEDAWLWYLSLGAHATKQEYEPIVEVARNHKSVFMRAAAIEALADARADVLYELVRETAMSMPKDPEERALMLGALSTALLRKSSANTRTTNEWQQMALALVVTLEDESTPRPARLAVARHLAKALGVEKVALEANYWRGEINAALADKKAKAPKPKQDDAPKYVRPRFFGVEATGERIAYVVDLSDSMCEPYEGEAKPKVTGPLSGPKKKPKGALPSEEDIPWHEVHNRFDLAREHLEISLQRLSEDQYFTIIGFGSRAEPLDGLPGMQKATKSNVKKALAALDDIRVGGPQPGKPHGVLEGNTNLHSALRLAFRVRDRGYVEEHEHVELDGFSSGCDTIFLLSDGDPSSDDYETEDADYGDGDVITDRESREPAERTAKLRYAGPYAQWPNLLDDVKRMNLFREVEIHCISIGDTQQRWLERLAELGLGTVTKR